MLNRHDNLRFAPPALRRSTFNLNYLDEHLRAENGNVATDDKGNLIFKTLTRDAWGTVSPVGYSDRILNSEVEIHVDDLKLSLDNPEKSIILKLRYQDGIFNILKQVSYQGLDVLIARKETARDTPDNTSEIPPYYSYHKKMEEVLNIPVINQAQNMRALHPPFLMFEENQTEWLHRHQVSKNTILHIYVNYHFFSRLKYRSPKLKEFQNIFYDDVFWEDKEIAVSHQGDIDRRVEDRGSGEYWEIFTFPLRFDVKSTVTPAVDAGTIERVDYDLVRRSE